MTGHARNSKHAQNNAAQCSAEQNNNRGAVHPDSQQRAKCAAWWVVMVLVQCVVMGRPAEQYREAVKFSSQSHSPETNGMWAEEMACGQRNCVPMLN
jgi:hypothetical protein